MVYTPNDDQTMLFMASKAGDIYTTMQQKLMLSLIKRMSERGTADLEENPYLWQLQKLQDMHMLSEENVARIAKESGISRKLLDKIIVNEGVKVYKDTHEQLAKETRQKAQGYEAYNDVKETLSAYSRQAFGDLDNLVNETLMSRNFIESKYRDMIQQVVGEVVVGGKTKNKAISDVAMKWINSGVGPFTDKAGRKWNVDTYARMVIQSTAYRVYNQMRTQASEELGVDTFYMSFHAAARPACSHIQGHIVTKGKGFRVPASTDRDVGQVYALSDYGYGEAGGTLGINCRHTLTPFVIGTNKMPNRDGLPKPDDAEENGKKQAQQRAIERAIRDNKYKLEAAKITGNDALVEKYKGNVYQQQYNLRRLLADNDFLHRDLSREKAYIRAGIHDIKERSFNNDFSVRDDIINSPKYSLAFNQLGYSSSTSKKLANAAKATIMASRDHATNGVEFDRTLVNNNGKTKVIQLSNGRYQQALNPDLSKLSTSNINIYVHNHPGSSSFSEQDLGTFATNSSINAMIAAGHNGTIYSLQRNGGKVLSSRNSFNNEYKVALDAIKIHEAENTQQVDDLAMILAENLGWNYGVKRW